MLDDPTAREHDRRPQEPASAFTQTTLDRVKYRLSRLTYGLATWRGYGARRLAAECAAANRNAIVIGCRFAPGFRGPYTTSEWRHVRVFVGDAQLRFDEHGRGNPQAVDVEAGAIPLRIEHDGPPPSFETTLDIRDGHTVLLEILPSNVRFAFTTPTVARLRIWRGRDELDAEHRL